MNVILALEVDSDEQTPVGVFLNVEDARDHILEQETERAEGADIEDEKDEFLRNMRDAIEQEHGAPVLDVQFESGFGSWDIRLVGVTCHY